MLQNYEGFSPFQLVFGESPRLPTVEAAGPPGWEEVSMNKELAEHINALHSAREAFIQCESDNFIITALNKKEFTVSRKKWYLEAGFILRMKRSGRVQ